MIIHSHALFNIFEQWRTCEFGPKQFYSSFYFGYAIRLRPIQIMSNIVSKMYCSVSFYTVDAKLQVVKKFGEN
jgi:hypothetical protein